MALLEVERLKIAYPQKADGIITWAVDDVSFSLDPGERIGFVGESGCGKSTIGKTVMRLLPEGSQIEGEIEYEKNSILTLKAADLRTFRGEVVSLVFQDPMTRLDPLMTIGEHCLETLQAHRPGLSRKVAKDRAIEALEAVKIPAERWGQYPHEFSGGMRQRVAIALALLLEPKVIVADEPTTSLDVTVSAEILDELTRLCTERDMALLLISHDLAMVGEYCDRIAVMYQGKIVEIGSTEAILHRPQHPYTKSLLDAALKLQADAKNDSDFQQAEKAEPLLKVKQLQQHFTLESSLIQQLLTKKKNVIKAVDGIDFELYSGEILGLVGESGCGKSTLSRTILQLLTPTQGSVEFLGQDLTKLSREEMRTYRRDIQMIFQDPHACLNPLMTVGESISDPLAIHRIATGATAKAKVSQMLEKVGLTPTEDYYHRYPSELSGGQQQRVAIARALITNPKLVICDEPVSMLDATVQTQVLELMLELKAEFELTYLFITHDLWVARFFCDRIAVMNGGKIIELNDTQEMFERPQHPYTQKLLSAAPLLVNC